MIYMNSRRKGAQKETHASNEAGIVDRKKDLGAVEGVGLKSLSGFNLSSDYICGIYLFKDRILFESKGLSLEIPHGWIDRVFIETQSYNALLSNYIPDSNPSASKQSSAGKPEQEAEFITKLTLVFEYKWNNSTPDSAVFAVSVEQFQDVKRFVERCDEYRKKVSGEKGSPG